jgi:uncharacterized protein (DUF2267 family)
LTVSNHIEALNSSLQKTNEWVRDVAAELGDDNRHHAYAALRATLHTLRDRLSVEQSAHFSAQLPLVLRGAYFEGWKSGEASRRVRTQEDFVENVRREMRDVTPLYRERCEQAVIASLVVIARHIDLGTSAKLHESLPRGLRELWPAYLS